MSRPRSLTAAVQRMELGREAEARSMQSASWSSSGKEDAWQAEAWQMVTEVGELSAVCRWMGSSASRVTLFAAEVDEETGKADSPSDKKLAQSIVSELAGGKAGQSSMLRQAAVLLTVVGEFYVVILQGEDGGDEWHLVAPDRVKRDMQGTFSVNLDGEQREVDPESESVFRVWEPDPHFPEQATSSVRAALPILREIRAMDKTITAAARSRVAGNGILVIPSEANVPDPDTAPRGATVGGTPRPSLPQQSSSAVNLSRSLSATMKRSLDDPASSAAVTPIVISAPKDTIDAIKHVRMDSEITEQAVSTRDRAIRRLALSLDIPPEILTGMGDSTHWNAALVDEAALRQHIAPMMETICEALTTAVLWPVLEEKVTAATESGGTVPDDGWQDVVVGFDMSALAQKQDKSDNAVAAYDKGAITLEALRRELGFGEDDAPGEQGEQERLRSLAEKMVTQAPSLFPYLAETLGFDRSKIPGVEPGGQTSEVPIMGRTVMSRGTDVDVQR